VAGLLYAAGIFALAADAGYAPEDCEDDGGYHETKKGGYKRFPG
jgi:hypothetical protein